MDNSFENVRGMKSEQPAWQLSHSNKNLLFIVGSWKLGPQQTKRARCESESVFGS
jgi:hypothetical protein